MQTAVSRVFMNGNSQAVRIPQEFRLSGSQVEIFRNTDGDLVIRPLPTERGTALLDVLKGFDEEYADALRAERALQPAMQDRESL